MNLPPGSIKRVVMVTLLFAVAIAVPPFLEPHLQSIAILICYFGYLGSCWNIIGGYAGQLSLSHAVFLGIGAYISTFLFLNFSVSPWIGMLVGGVVSAATGVIIGYPCFRFGVRGPYFALITVAFGELMKQLFINWQTFGGASGLLIPFKNPGLKNILFKGKLEYYYVVLALLIAVLTVSWMISKSRFGLYLLCIKQNEEASEAIGINVLRYKLCALSMSAFLTAIGGTFYAHYLLYIEPNTVMGIGLSIDMILAPIIGGAGTVLGPVIGSFILNIISELSKAIFGGITGRLGGVHILIYGLLLIIIVLFYPKGIMGYLKEKTSKKGMV
jgi:branched-chain amino acid transport system permease protein